MELLVNQNFLRYYNQDLIAKSGIKTLYDVSQDKDNKEIFKKLFESKKLLLNKHPDNIVLRNAINLFLHKLNTHKIKKEIQLRKDNLSKRLDNINKDVALLGSKKIKPGSSVFIHSINNQIMEIIKRASQYKKFSINLVEHSPLMFGKILKEKLKKLDIKVFFDLSIRDAVKSSDMCLIGAEAILKNKGCVAKTGSNLSVICANENNIPVYFCAHSLKYDHKHHMLNQLAHEIEDSNHDVTRIYEYVSPDKITAYISEYGIFKPEYIINEFQLYNKWMFI